MRRRRRRPTVQRPCCSAPSASGSERLATLEEEARAWEKEQIKHAASLLYYAGYDNRGLITLQHKREAGLLGQAALKAQEETARTQAQAAWRLENEEKKEWIRLEIARTSPLRNPLVDSAQFHQFQALLRQGSPASARVKRKKPAPKDKSERKAKEKSQEKKSQEKRSSHRSNPSPLLPDLFGVMEGEEIKKWLQPFKTIASIVRLPGDASSRKYFRVSVAPGESYIVMRMEPFSQETAASLTFLAVQGFLSQSQVPVPQVHWREPERGLIVLEDLGDQTLLHRLAAVGSEAEETALYQQVIDLLVHFQLKTAAACEASKAGPVSGAKQALPLLECFQLRFDYEKLMWECPTSHFPNPSPLSPPHGLLFVVLPHLRSLLTWLSSAATTTPAATRLPGPQNFILGKKSKMHKNLPKSANYGYC